MNGPIRNLKTNLTDLAHSGLVSLDTSIMTINYVCFMYQTNIDTFSYNYFTVNVNTMIDSGGSSFDFNYKKYGFTLIDYNGCVSYINNINLNDLTNFISIFPNPTNGIFQLKNESEPIENARFYTI